jgi:hypothetical protein
MTTTLDARSGSKAAPTVRRVVPRLALGEAVRIVRNPVTWLATAGSLWLTWRWVGQTAPILFRDSVYVVGGLMPLAAAALLLGNFATLREKDTEENQLLESLPNPAMVRTGGLLGAGATWACVALSVEGAAVWFLLAGEPIGQFRWLELASGPVIVATAWCGGVLSARWAPWGVVAPLALVALAFVTLVSSPDAVLFSPESEPKHSFEWLALWTPPSSFGPAEAQLFRPVGPRLFYLAVLLAVTAGLALARHFATSVRRLTAVSAAAVLFTAAAVAPTQTPNYWWDGVDWQAYFDEQHCEMIGDVTYCAFPGYRDWIPRWHDTIEATRRLVPIEVEHVIQRPSTSASQTMSLSNSRTWCSPRTRGTGPGLCRCGDSSWRPMPPSPPSACQPDRESGHTLKPRSNRSVIEPRDDRRRTRIRFSPSSAYVWRSARLERLSPCGQPSRSLGLASTHPSPPPSTALAATDGSCSRRSTTELGWRSFQWRVGRDVRRRTCTRHLANRRWSGLGGCRPALDRDPRAPSTSSLNWPGGSISPRPHR